MNYENKLFCMYREFFGPIIGGTLTRFMSFEDSTTVRPVAITEDNNEWMNNQLIDSCFNFIGVWRATVCPGEMVHR